MQITFPDPNLCAAGTIITINGVNYVCVAECAPDGLTVQWWEKDKQEPKRVRDQN